jgi:uncharacterized protein YlxW (UPF0749 family)
VWQVTLLSGALGLLLALAIRTTERIHVLGLPSARAGASAADLSRYEEQNRRLEREVDELSDQINQFRANGTNVEQSRRLLKEQLLEYKALVGFAPMAGPGVKITLRDSPVKMLPGSQVSDYWVTDQDIIGLVSELWAAGAEGVSVASAAGKDAQRFVTTTSVLNNGRTVTVNGRNLSPPYVIRAIGNPKELRAALEMPEGIVQNRGLNVLKMITIEEAEQLVLPAYSGSRTARHAAAKNE